jgi:hypothetical protein
MSVCEVQAVPFRVSRYKQSHVASSVFDRPANEQSTKVFKFSKRFRVTLVPRFRGIGSCRFGCPVSIGGNVAAPLSTNRPSFVRSSPFKDSMLFLRARPCDPKGPSMPTTNRRLNFRRVFQSR